MAIITFSRTYGCGVRELGANLARKLGYHYFDKDLIPIIAKKVGITKEQMEGHEEMQDILSDYVINVVSSRYTFLKKDTVNRQAYIENIKEVVLNLANQGNAIIIGRGSQCILQNYPNAIHIRIVADIDFRVEHLRKYHYMESSGDMSIKGVIKKVDDSRKKYLKVHFGKDWDDPTLYHVVINLAKISLANAEKIILGIIETEV